MRSQRYQQKPAKLVRPLPQFSLGHFFCELTFIRDKMESINLMMEDFNDGLFDDNEVEEFPPIPEMPSLSPPRENDDDENAVVSQAINGDGNADPDVAQAALEDIPTTRAGRRVVRNPQPKLDAHRLTNGERGIAVIPVEFSKLKFKGKGHETADMKMMMQKYEHWAHRLFPKMPFDDVIERIEKLGNKKPVQVCMKKIRLDMPLTDEDFGRGEEGRDDGDEEENPDLVSLVKRNQSQSSFQVHTPNDDVQLSSQTAPGSPSFSSPQSQSKTAPTPQTSLSKEQLERIERNKRLAREKREGRMRMMAENAAVSSSQADSETISNNVTVTSSQVDSETGNDATKDVTLGSGETADNVQTERNEQLSDTQTGVKENTEGSEADAVGGQTDTNNGVDDVVALSERKEEHCMSATAMDINPQTETENISQVDGNKEVEDMDIPNVNENDESVDTPMDLDNLSDSLVAERPEPTKTGSGDADSGNLGDNENTDKTEEQGQISVAKETTQ
ncbi:TIMELESS-interacting protein-like isoform X2 [Ptychodera flava]|uniref:TIMELESS-interacting protein-like isoform X2 n=1 Tax=Ptychodera flava TaxID=63121 RepID=UPI00396A21FE